jgi:HEAT repeat protein
MRGVMRALACDEAAGSLLREFVAQVKPDAALDAMRYLSTVSKLSSHATTLLQSLSLTEKPDAAPTELPEGVLSDMVDLFGDDDPDRFNPQDHRELLNEVAVHIPNLSPRMLSNIEVLGNRVESVRDAEIERLLSRTLIELLMSLGTSRDAQPLLRRIEALFRSYLSAGEFGDALETCERLQEIAISTTSDQLRTALDTTFTELANPETTQALIESLLHAKPEQTPTIQRLIEAMGSAATRGLLLALAEETNRSRRRKLFDVVVGLGPVIVPEVTRFLSDPRWFVVRNMIAILRTVNDRSALAEVRKLAQHRDLRVRLEAIKTLIGPDSSLPIAMLNDAINDPDPKLAETAIMLVGNYGIKEGVAPLLKILSHTDVFGRKKPLRIHAIRALGELAVPTALPEMDKFFRDPFLPWPAVEERRAAFESLSSYPVEAAAPLIERGLTSRDPQVRAICLKLSAR